MTRPFVSLKLATSLDGKIALSNGQSKWITSEASRQKGRELRAEHDGICIGANTAELDDPRLTARVAGSADPVRIIYDSRLRLSAGSILAQTAGDIPVFVFCDKDLKTADNLLKSMGVSMFPIRRAAKGLDIEQSLDILVKNGVSTLLVEGGGTLAASFLKGGFVDRIHWFRAPMILGGDGRNCIGDMAFLSLDNTPRYQRQSLDMIGPDTYEILEQIA